MKALILFFVFLSLNASAQVKTLAQDIRTNYCYLTVIEQIIIPSGKETVMVGDVRLTMNTRDYQRSRRLLPGRTFKIRSVDGTVFNTDDVIKSFCVWSAKDCNDISDSNKSAFSSFSKGGLKVICEDRPMTDI